MVQRYLFVTGRLAAESLRNAVASLSPEIEYEIAALPMSVAALMNTRFVAKHLAGAMGCDKVMIPGLCRGDPGLIQEKLGREVIRGPKSLKDIPKFFGMQRNLGGYGHYRVKIIAEIVDAYRIGMDKILDRASYYKAGGADIIDLGCPPEGGFPELEEVIRTLKAKGFSVSVDSFNAGDILKADRAGADFVLSIHSGNLGAARNLRCKAVAIPDSDGGLESLERTISQLEDWNISFIVDPILNPISFGFTESIRRFISIRDKHPRAEMLMGIGNLTELTDADTTGITAVMAGIIEELKIDYVLTTEEISWAHGAVRELDLARRLMHYACREKIPPKHLDDGLITVKDPPFDVFGEEELRALQANVRDRHLRIFADRKFIYVFNNKLFIKETNIQSIFDRLNIKDASHAFYLGKELQKALLAVRLGKRYIQEEELRWGYLSRNHDR
jgi:dihydropteroate synthase-like protein